MHWESRPTTTQHPRHPANAATNSRQQLLQLQTAPTRIDNRPPPRSATTLTVSSVPSVPTLAAYSTPARHLHPRPAVPKGPSATRRNCQVRQV
ncbi:hypothetical protein C8Q76DRAFT_293274 [Earliella scabrosa]|nr:hypothetical protein C8Q76DRAFT_293274 [Earliella scabrosa]